MVSAQSTAVSAQHAEDIAFARAMHGKEVKTGFLSNLSSKNRDVSNVASETYLNMWKKPENETKEDESKRLDSYTDLVNSYYNLATDFYEYGNISCCFLKLWLENIFLYIYRERDEKRIRGYLEMKGKQKNDLLTFIDIIIIIET